MLGTMHGFDSNYIFGYMNSKEAPLAFPEDAKTEGDMKIGTSIIKAWTSFAKTGYVYCLIYECPCGAKVS